MVSLITVVGNGIVGIATAIELNRMGHKVVVIDRDPPGSPGAASFGNGGWLCPASIIPVSTQGLMRNLPSLVFGRNAPLSGQVLYGLRNAGHFVRFVMSGRTNTQVQYKALSLSTLLSRSADDHLDLARQAGLDSLIRKDGLLYTYDTGSAYSKDLTWWTLRTELGVKSTFIDSTALRSEEPLIDRECHGALLVEDGGHCIDPGAYLQGLAAFASSKGVEFVTAEVLGLRFDEDRLDGLDTSSGFHPSGAAVICCGAHSRIFAWQAGDNVPLLSERGYHVTIADGLRLSRPVMFNDALVVATPMAAGLRLAGQVEIAAPGTPPDWRRAQRLLDLASGYIRGLPSKTDAPQVSRWMGQRPAIADELPVIGTSSRSADVHYAFGHGYTGLGAAPVTARMVGQSVAGMAPRSPEPFPFLAQRFRQSPR
ncbi:D-amino-acid dehydrogenase [Rhizobium aquaticum]|uniref:D-amino-acid dehydrogenase n=1 Tax=Rhizobium aquaticum TaxID=1549636 RepID=A0ABV2J6Z3_9HYPH